MTRICVCGGGSLGHVCAGVLGSRPDIELRLFTRNPELWGDSIEIRDPDGKTYDGKISLSSSDPARVVTGSDIVLLCLPGYAIEPTLERIRDYVGDAVVGSVVSSTGFFFAAHAVLGPSARLFGFQRVPYIARTVEYGRRANLLGYKPRLSIAVENVEDRESFRALVETLWETPVSLLGSFYEAALTNSNPILHTGRLYTMFSGEGDRVYDHNILFYKEWTDEASRMILAMDAEFMDLLDALGLTPGCIPSLLEYYESTDESSLTRKIRSIGAFQTITSPMKEAAGGWVPDYQSRYFTEDFPYGLKIIVDLCREYKVNCPTLSAVYHWGMEKIV